MRNLVNGGLEGKRVGRYAIIRNNNSVCFSQSYINKIKFLPLLGKVRMGFNQSNTGSLLPTLSPFLIREGVQTTGLPSYPPTLLPSGKIAFTLTEGATHVALSNSQRKAAFTLAEVLITLGIIGVVAAMTMPAVIQEHREKELAVRARKAFSIVINATKLAQSQNEMIGDNTFLFDPLKTSAEVAQEYAKYFNGAKVCPSKTSAGCSQYFYDRIKYSISGYSYFFNGWCPLILLPDGSVLAINQLTSCTQSTFMCDATDPDTGNCTTDSDGKALGQYSNLNYCANIIIDVNGPKPTNQYGRDVYFGRVWQNGKITFNDWEQTGSVSARNILMGIDKLEYKKF